MLAVLTLAVHPFELPEQNRAIDLELLPPLTPPPMPTVEVQLRPRQREETPPPAPRTQPLAPRSQPESSPLEAVRPQTAAQERPVEVERRAAQAPRLQTQQAAPLIPEAPPEPVAVTRPAPTARPQVEIPRAEAQGRTRPLDTSRAAPQLPQTAAPEAPAPEAPAAEAAPPQRQVQVLTNESVVRAPVEIRPRERTPLPPRVTAQPGAADIPSPGAGAPPPGGGAAGAGGGQAGGRTGARPEDFNVNGGLRGLRQTLGCEDPDTYKLTPEERAACLQRFGQRAKDAADLGLAVAAGKKAEYDAIEACRDGYRRKEGAIPNAYVYANGSSISGVAPLPKACVSVKPGDR